MRKQRKFPVPPRVLLLVLLIMAIQLALALLPHLFREESHSALTVAHAGEKTPALRIQRAWSPEAPPVVKVLAAYMILENTGAADRHIVRLSSPDFDRVEIHRMQAKDGMMRMVEQKSLLLPAGRAVTLQPGDLHMMLIGPRRVFRDGDHFTITVELDDGQRQSVQVPVRKRNS